MNFPTTFANSMMKAAVSILFNRGETQESIRTDDLEWGLKAAWRAHSAEVIDEWEMLADSNVGTAWTQTFVAVQALELASEAVRVYDGW
jgi:hypothetical protein